MYKISVCTFLGMEPRELAATLKIPLMTVHNWEMGYTVPDLCELAKLMKFTGLSADELLFGQKSEMLDISGLDMQKRRLVTEVYQSFLSMNQRNNVDESR